MIDLLHRSYFNIIDIARVQLQCNRFIRAVSPEREGPVMRVFQPEKSRLTRMPKSIFFRCSTISSFPVMSSQQRG